MWWECESLAGLGWVAYNEDDPPDHGWVGADALAMASNRKRAGPPRRYFRDSDSAFAAGRKRAAWATMSRVNSSTSKGQA